MLKYIYVLILTLISFSSFAGNIKGNVKDSTDNSPLTGVIINIRNTSFVAQTDLDGNFELKNVPNGKFEMVFSFITYEKLVRSVVIKSSADVELNIVLVPEHNKQLGAVTVSANRVTHTESAVLQEIKNSNTIVSGIGSAQISKTMDRNAADVVKRVPGVTIQDDRFIVVRGLADRYNTVWLNDAGAPSSETDKKAFSFDIIPSGLIDRIMIFKTPSPELPGDFAGGMVKVYTTSLVDRNQIVASVQTSSRSYATGRPFAYAQTSKTDWLGFDNGSRSLPANTDHYITKNDPDNEAISKSFGNDWGIKTKTASPDYRIGIAASNTFNLGKVRLGNTFGLSYSNTNMAYNIHRADWDNKRELYNYNDNYSANSVGAGLMDNLGIAVGNVKIEFKNLYSQIGKSSVTQRTNIRDTFASTPDERSYLLSYESRATYTSQLLGSYKSNNNKTKYNWAFGYTDLYKNIPDQRRIKYTKDYEQPDSMYKTPIVAGSPDIYNGGGRFYSELFEHVYSFNHQFTQTINIGDNFHFDINAGNYLEYKSRFYYSRTFGYTLKTGPDANDLKRLPIDQIFADSNVGPKDRFRIEEITNNYDKYFANNTLLGSFISVHIPIKNKVNIVGGVRYEYNTQNLGLYKSVDTNESYTTKLTTKFWLPSVNVSYNITDKMLVRVAYGKTLNRPEFREVAPSPYYNFDDKELIYGSLYPSPISLTGYTLDVAQVQNYDARWEWYPDAGEMIQFGAFYKSFKDPIQRVIVGTDGSGSKQITFINGTSAYVGGIEIDVRKSLSFIDDLCKTNIFKDISIVGNLSLTKSHLNLDTAAINKKLESETDFIPSSSMQGQSPYVVNAGLFYANDKNGFQGSILYNVYGPRIYALGRVLTANETVFEMPFRSFDATVSKTFFKHYALSFGVQNILNAKMQFMKDINYDNKIDKTNDSEVRSYRPGSYFTVGVKVKF